MRASPQASARHASVWCPCASSLLSDDSGSIPSLARATCLQERQGRQGHARTLEDAFEPVLRTGPPHWRLHSLRRFPPCLRFLLACSRAQSWASLGAELPSTPLRPNSRPSGTRMACPGFASFCEASFKVQQFEHRALRPTSPAWPRLPRRSRPSHLRAGGYSGKQLYPQATG